MFKKIFGLTLVEALIFTFIFGLIVLTIYSAHWLSQRAYFEGERAAEILQNGRVILERMVREIRQAREIVTDLPVTSTDAPDSLEFEDGHVEERYFYIRYFKEGKNLKREIKRYYFSGDPNTYVPWNANPPEGQEKLTTTTESQIIGEFVKDLKFWGGKLVNIFLDLEKGEKSLKLFTSAFGRNL